MFVMVVLAGTAVLLLLGGCPPVTHSGSGDNDPVESDGLSASPEGFGSSPEGAPDAAPAGN